MKALLRLILGLAGLVMVAVIGVGFFIATLDPNDHKDWIIGKVQEQTGRKLSLDGDIRLALYPWIDLEVNGLTLANAPGFGAAPFLHVDHLNVRVKTIPLLREKYEVDTVKVTGALVNLARNKDGVSNWADLVKPGAEESGPLPLTAIVLGGADVQQAQINWSDAQAGTEYKVKNLTFTTGQLVYGEPVELNLTTTVESSRPALSSDLRLNGVLKYDVDAGRYAAEPLTLDGVLRSKQLPGGQTPVNFSAALNADLEADTAAITGLKFSALKTNVSGELHATNVESGKPTVESKLDLQGEDLSLLFKVLEVEPLASQIAGISDRGFRLNTRLQADMARGDANLSELNAQVLGATVTGEVKAANIQSDTPSFKGALSAAGPNLPLLLQVMGQMQGGARSPLARVGKQIGDFPQREFMLDTAFDADMKSGDIALPKLVAKLLGAEINANLTARNVHTATPSFKGKFAATGGDLPVLLQLAGALQDDKDAALLTYGKKLGRVTDKKFDVKLDFDADLKSGNVNIPALAATGLGLNVVGNIKASDMSSRGGNATGQLSVTGAQLQGLLTALDQEGLGETLRSIKFDAGIAGSGRSVTLKPMSMEALVVSQELGNKPVKITAGADTTLDLDAQTLGLEALSVQGLGLDMRGNLKAEKIIDAPEFTGKLSVAPFNLRQFMRQLKIKPPAMRDREALRTVALQSEFSGSQKDLRLSKINAQLDDTKVKGDFSVQNFDKPSVRFGIDVDQIDFDRYRLPEEQVTAEAEKAAAAGGTTGKAAGKVGRMPVPLLRKLDVQGTITAGTLIYNKARLNQAKITIAGKDGILRLDPLTAKFYQGTHDGNVTLDVTGKLPKLTINSKLTGVQAEPLLKDVMGKAKARGTANFNAALVASGASAPAIKRTLNGKMRFSITDGAIKGYNLGKIMRQGKSLKDTFSLGVSDQEETDLSEITGNPVATNGVVTMDDLKGASPALRISGKGVIANLPTNSIDYRLTATIVATSQGQGGKELQEGKLDGVPLECKIKGSLDEPRRECDASKLIAAMGLGLLKSVIGAPTDAMGGAASGAADAVGGAATAIGGGAASLLKSLTGGKDSTAPAPATQTAPVPKSTAPAPAPAPKSTAPAPATQTAPKKKSTTATNTSKGTTSATTTTTRSTSTQPATTTTTTATKSTTTKDAATAPATKTTTAAPATTVPKKKKAATTTKTTTQTDPAATTDQ